MNLEMVKKIADAVLYEGYMLYPYRASSVKNRQRFNWGTLLPESYTNTAMGSETSRMKCECLVTGDENVSVSIKLRFLHLTNREIGEVIQPNGTGLNYKIVPRIEIDGKTYLPWQEANEREIDVFEIKPSDGFLSERFSYASSRALELLKDQSDAVKGVVIRSNEQLNGTIKLSSTKLGSQIGQRSVYRLNIEITNTTPFDRPEARTRDDALLHSIVSAHMILNASRGEFISLLDPPGELKDEAERCRSVGCFPVLAGDKEDRNLMLVSPIILYDYPEIAPESPGDLFDGTEIDEILTLRILTLTDDEKREALSVDEHARKLLERSAALSRNELMRMHGVLRP